jgi:hypothetical protein
MQSWIRGAVLVLALTVCSTGALAANQRREPAPAPERQPTVVTTLEDRNANDVREQLGRLLEQYPPSLAQVLRMDPSLLNNPEYLAPYPALKAFLTQHAEVAHNPGYFLGQYRYEGPYDARRQALNLWEGVMAGLAGFTAALIVIFVLGWLLRTLIDYRRWLRISKIQTEVHTKLLDRFGANEDLLAYMQTPAGRRFLESAPIPLDAGPRSLSAPLGRILWSVQAGVVLAMGGLGLQYVSSRVMDDVREPIFVIGVLALALGIGFVISAVVAYMLTRQLGLIERRPPKTGAESGPAPSITS